MGRPIFLTYTKCPKKTVLGGDLIVTMAPT